MDKHSLWMWWWSLMNLCPDWSTTCSGVAAVLMKGSGVVLEVGADAAGRLLPVIVSTVSTDLDNARGEREGDREKEREKTEKEFEKSDRERRIGSHTHTHTHYIT